MLALFDRHRLGSVMKSGNIGAAVLTFDEHVNRAIRDAIAERKEGHVLHTTHVPRTRDENPDEPAAFQCRRMAKGVRELCDVSAR